MASQSSTRSTLLAALVLAACALAAPSMASAASWAVVGTTHVLSSNTLAFTTVLFGSPAGWTCGDTELHAVVSNATALEINGAAFRNCTGALVLTNCTVTMVATRFPWTATAPATTDIQFHGVFVDMLLEDGPGGACSLPGFAAMLTGTVAGGSFDPSATGANRRLTFNHADGLIMDTVLGSAPVGVTGSIRDTAGTLQLLD